MHKKRDNDIQQKYGSSIMSFVAPIVRDIQQRSDYGHLRRINNFV